MHARHVRVRGFLSDAQYTWILVITIAIIASWRLRRDQSLALCSGLWLEAVIFPEPHELREGEGWETSPENYPPGWGKGYP